MIMTFATTLHCLVPDHVSGGHEIRMSRSIPEHGDIDPIFVGGGLCCGAPTGNLASVAVRRVRDWTTGYSEVRGDWGR